MSRSLIVLPDDSAKPIVDAIDAAAKSLRIKMFSLSDPRNAGCADPGAPTRRQDSRHAQPGAPQRRDSE